jgi:hypothetical protein
MTVFQSFPKQPAALRAVQDFDAITQGAFVSDVTAKRSGCAAQILSVVNRRLSVAIRLICNESPLEFRRGDNACIQAPEPTIPVSCDNIIRIVSNRLGDDFD